jgi:hypothetical protein
MTEQTRPQKFIVVRTFDPDGRPAKGPDGKSPAERIVDMHHPNTFQWLQKHIWWASTNAHTVEVSPAGEQEVQEYLAWRAKELQEKFAA